MKPSYAPGTCSFAPHIALIEADHPVQLVKVTLTSHTLADGTGLLVAYQETMRSRRSVQEAKRAESSDTANPPSRDMAAGALNATP